MKTRYEKLQSACDTLNTLIRQLADAREVGLAFEAQKLRDALEIKMDESWKAEYAEPELETEWKRNGRPFPEAE
jgi:hypothetical protein